MQGVNHSEFDVQGFLFIYLFIYDFFFHDYKIMAGSPTEIRLTQKKVLQNSTHQKAQKALNVQFLCVSRNFAKRAQFS